MHVDRHSGTHSRLGIIRRYWYVVILAGAVSLGSAYYYASTQPKLFQASADVLLSEQNLPASLVGPQGSQQRDPDRYGATQARLARTPEVAGRTVKAADVSISAGELLAQSTVEPTSNADLLHFAVTDEHQQRAITLVNAYAKQFITYRTALDTAVVHNALQGIAKRIDRVQTQLRSTSGDKSLLRQQLAVLLNKQQDLRNLEALQGGNLFVVKQATSAPQIQPRVSRTLVIGGIIGLLTGIALAFGLGSWDRKVRDTEEIAEELGIPLLARVPPPRRGRKLPRVAMLGDKDTQQIEAFRKLRANVDFANLTAQCSVLLVTSALEQEGKSTTVANLALAMARNGRRVLLVDLDLRRPMLEKFFSLEGRRGVTDLVAGYASLDQCVHSVASSPEIGAGHDGNGAALDHGRLDVLPVGQQAIDPADFVGSERLRQVLASLRDRYDAILIDSPPILAISDALVLSSLVDRILVVTRLKMLDRSVLHELKRVVGTAPAKPLGFIATDVEDTSQYGYGDYAYTPPVRTP